MRVLVYILLFACSFRSCFVFLYISVCMYVAFALAVYVYIYNVLFAFVPKCFCCLVLCLLGFLLFDNV